MKTNRQRGNKEGGIFIKGEGRGGRGGGGNGGTSEHGGGNGGGSGSDGDGGSGGSGGEEVAEAMVLQTSLAGQVTFCILAELS